MNSFLKERLNKLNDRLLDITSRNKMISSNFNAKNRRFFRFIDEIPNVLYKKLQTNSMSFAWIPEEKEEIDDEDTEEFKQEDFNKETEQIFNDNPYLLPKLEKMQKHVLAKIFDIIDMEDSKVNVSLLVYSNFKKLVNLDIRTEFRGLEILRQEKSKFDPSQN